MVNSLSPYFPYIYISIVQKNDHTSLKFHEHSNLAIYDDEWNGTD